MGIAAWIHEHEELSPFEGMDKRISALVAFRRRSDRWFPAVICALGFRATVGLQYCYDSRL